MKSPFSSPSRLRLWEAALFLAFGLTLTAGVWASASEAALAGQVLRLHVIANSDSEADQARKLLVRDAVLSRAAQLLDGADGRQEAEAALAAMQASPYGRDAAIIGRVAAADEARGPKVFLRTAFGSTRILDMLVGEQLPRIC